MSMWEFEALAESCVLMVAASDLPLEEKRNLYASAYEMVSGFDVSFVHFRTTQQLIDAQFLFRIDMESHPEFNAQKEIFAEMMSADAKSNWLSFGPKGEYGYRSGPADGIYQKNEIAGHPPGLWFDATMPLWQKAVDAGLLTGLAAEPVQILDTKSAILRFADLADWSGEKWDGLLKMLHGFVAYTLVYSETPVKAGDPDLADMRALPSLKRALANKQEDWIDERFDARQGLEYAEGDQKAFLDWWCAPYGG